MGLQDRALLLSRPLRPRFPLKKKRHISSSSIKMAVSSAYPTTSSQPRPSQSVDKPAAVNAWSGPGPAASDLRSDVHTCPTPSMLAAIQQTTLLDDVSREDPTTNALEAFVASLAGKEAALLVLSGTMGNQVALRSHLAHPPHSIVCDRRSHVFVHEAGGLSNGALIIPMVPKNGHHITLQDIQSEAVLDDDVHSCPTRLIVLENTLWGTVLPLAEVQAISSWARAQDPPIALHMDGARLWEAVAAGHGSLKDYAACFDSISLCFSKGLGAPVGSMLVGTEKFIKQARWNRKAIGGGLRQSGIIAAPARVAVEETFLGGRLTACHDRARIVAAMWEKLGGKLAVPVETNMVWLELDDKTSEALIRLCADQGVKVAGARLVIHYQIADDVITKLGHVFEQLLQK